MNEIICMEITVIFPVICGILFSFGNLFLKNGLVDVSLSNLNALLNQNMVYGVIVCAIGAIIFWYSLKVLPLWLVILATNAVSTVASILLGVFILKEFISPLRGILIVLTVSFLIGAMALK